MLSYAPFLGAQVLAKPNQRALVADFIVGLFLSRIPILLFQAVQAALLPKLSTLVSAGRDDEFQNGVRKLVLIVVGIGVLGVVVGGLDRAVRRAASCSATSSTSATPTSRCSRPGSGLFILALTLSQALIALSRPPSGDDRVVRRARRVRRRRPRSRRHELFLRVELGSIAGAGVSAAAMGWFFLQPRRAAACQAGSLASLVEQIEYGPLEI